MSPGEADILVVDDDPADAELTVRALESARYGNRIVIARDGEEALDFLFGGADGKRAPEDLPKLILLDLNMPKVDGLEVLRQIKEDPGTQAVPVVILTSSCQPSDLARAYQLGTNSYIQKPVDFDRARALMKLLADYWLLVNHAAPRDWCAAGPRRWEP